jgi:hypothetical protein
MIILGIRVTNVAEVLAQYNQIRIYRDDVQGGTFTNQIGIIPLVAGTTDYEFTDNAGDSTSWYKASYYSTAQTIESDLSPAFKGVPLEGPLGLLTPNYLRANTDFVALAALSDSKLSEYIWRAETIIQNYAAQYGGVCTDIANYQVMMPIVAKMIVEQLFLTTSPQARAQAVSGFKQERIGSYQYTRFTAAEQQSVQTTSTGPIPPEAMAILDAFVCGTSSRVHMKTTQVFPEINAIPGDPLTPALVGVEIRPWHEFTDLQLRGGRVLWINGPYQELIP